MNQRPPTRLRPGLSPSPPDALGLPGGASLSGRSSRAGHRRRCPCWWTAAVIPGVTVPLLAPAHDLWLVRTLLVRCGRSACGAFISAKFGATTARGADCWQSGQADRRRRLAHRSPRAELAAVRAAIVVQGHQGVSRQPNGSHKAWPRWLSRFGSTSGSVKKPVVFLRWRSSGHAPAQQHVSRYPPGVNPLSSADRASRSGKLSSLQSKYQEEQEPQDAPRRPGNTEPEIPGGPRIGEDVQEHRHGGDGDEQAEPAQAAPVGAIVSVPGDPEVGEREEQGKGGAP